MNTRSETGAFRSSPPKVPLLGGSEIVATELIGWVILFHRQGGSRLGSVRLVTSENLSFILEMIQQYKLSIEIVSVG